MRHAFTVVTFLCLLLVGTAQAAERGYDAVVRDAIAEYQAGNLAEARALFTQAHALQPSAKTLRGLGMVAFEQKRYIEATDLLRQALDDPRAPLPDRARSETEQLLARAEAFVGRFTVTMTPASAELTVDGQAVTLAQDGLLRLQIGNHRLQATAPGHDPTSKTLDVSGAERDVAIALQLTPAPAAPLPAPVATTPAPQPTDAEPEASPAPNLTASADLAEARATPWLPVMLVSAGGVALVAGTVAGSFAMVRARHVEDGCPDKVCDEDLQDDADSAETLGMTANVLWIAGGLLATTGIVLWALDDGGADEHATVAAPLLGRDLAGLQLEGSF